jgi:hypothetical protein
MSMKSRGVVFGLACLLGAATTIIPSAAQTVYRPRHRLPPPRYARPYIEIRPQHLIYRRCVDWLELQHRPSGTVLFPQYRCWWVTG